MSSELAKNFISTCMSYDCSNGHGLALKDLQVLSQGVHGLNFGQINLGVSIYRDHGGKAPRYSRKTMANLRNGEG